MLPFVAIVAVHVFVVAHVAAILSVHVVAHVHVAAIAIVVVHVFVVVSSRMPVPCWLLVALVAEILAIWKFLADSFVVVVAY